MYRTRAASRMERCVDSVCGWVGENVYVVSTMVDIP